MTFAVRAQQGSALAVEVWRRGEGEGRVEGKEGGSQAGGGQLT